MKIIKEALTWFALLLIFFILMKVVEFLGLNFFFESADGVVEVLIIAALAIFFGILHKAVKNILNRIF